MCTAGYKTQGGTDRKRCLCISTSHRVIYVLQRSKKITTSTTTDELQHAVRRRAMATILYIRPSLIAVVPAPPYIYSLPHAPVSLSLYLAEGMILIAFSLCVIDAFIIERENGAIGGDRVRARVSVTFYKWCVSVYLTGRCVMTPVLSMLRRARLCARRWPANRRSSFIDCNRRASSADR